MLKKRRGKRLQEMRLEEEKRQKTAAEGEEAQEKAAAGAEKRGDCGRGTAKEDAISPARFGSLRFPLGQ